MQPLSRHLLRASFVRRTLCGGLAVAYLATAAGIPLPVTARPAKSSESYPCAGGGCGCHSADQCWRSCCCHSLAERLAWARRNGVRPPDDAIAEARRSGLDVAWLAGNSPRGTKRAKTCCASDVETNANCCQDVASNERAETSNHARCAHCKSAHSPSDNSHDSQIVVWRAMKCHGNSLNWLAAVPVLLHVQPSSMHDSTLAAWLGPAVSDSATGTPLDPAVPPPEPA